jgi:hypothetical protein
VCLPGDLLSVLNCTPEVTLRVIRVFATQTRGFLSGELLLTVFRQEVVFNVDEFAILVYPVGLLAEEHTSVPISHTI